MFIEQTNRTILELINGFNAGILFLFLAIIFRLRHNKKWYLLNNICLYLGIKYFSLMMSMYYLINDLLWNLFLSMVIFGYSLYKLMVLFIEFLPLLYKQQNTQQNNEV